jgi:hypothetical protein
MTSILQVSDIRWSGSASPEAVSAAGPSLEGGDVLFLPDLAFEVEAAETLLFNPSILGSSKNASYDPASDRLGGTTATGAEAETLRRFICRYSDSTASLVAGLLPRYRDRIARGRASFRPAEIAGRATSWRKDDTRLHVDSFPATPSGGRRILRVFSNVNPEGRPRAWRLGDSFEAVAARFAPQLRLPLPGAGRVLALLRVTKTPRSAYDALMLQLHDRMKADDVFQKESPQSRVELPARSTWLAFTDQVSHAATSGQYQLEQTFLLPVDAMHEPERSPLRVLERLKGRALV